MLPIASEKVFGLARLKDPRWIINASILVLALMVLALSLSAGWQAYREFHAARQVHIANALAKDAISAAGIAAVERGITSAMLGREAPPSPEMQAALVRTRAQCQTHWRSFRKNAQHFSDAGKFRKAYAHALSTHRALVEARIRVDNRLAKREPGIDIPDWIHTVAEYNRTLERASSTLFAQHYWRNQTAALNLSLQHWIWVVSENAGLERGIMAYYLSSRTPVPAGTLDELRSFRTLVEHNIGNILQLVLEPDTDPRIRDAAAEMRRRFLGDFSPIRERIYQRVATGNFALSAPEWIKLSTQAINGALDLATVVSDVSGEVADRARRASFWNLMAHAGLVAIALVLLFLSTTKVRQTANLLFREKELAEVTLHSIGDAVITTDAQANVEYLNPIAEGLTGWTNYEAAGRPLNTVVQLLNGFTREPDENPVEKCLRDKCVVGLADNTVLLSRDGREYTIEDSAAPIRDREGNVVGAVMVFYDVSSVTEHSHLLAHYATHDTLTGLANRREFERRLTDLLASAKRKREQHALCYIDLDQFKLVNDTCGHMVGDKLLRQLTYLLEQHVRDSDVLARLGGDEFGLLLQNCPLPRAEQIAENVRNVVKGFRFVWEGKSFELGCSIGLVPVTYESVSPTELLSEADAACYAAKEKGRNRVQVFEPGDIELARRHGEMQWVSRLTNALREDRLVLYVQDIQPFTPGVPLHREILLRLRDEDGEIVPPMSFIPAAERYNLMAEIDRWVIKNTLAWASNTGDEQSRDVIYNINLSGTSVSDPGVLLKFIEQQFVHYPVSPGRICFEITETAAVQNLVQVAELIGTLRERGFRFALDDFGSGLSSFMYLKTLPVDFLKIDGSFVRDMVNDPIDLAMVQSINTIGHVMGIKTIAEFVEDEATIAELRKLGIDFGQGFGIHRPEPLDRKNGHNPGP